MNQSCEKQWWWARRRISERPRRDGESTDRSLCVIDKPEELLLYDARCNIFIGALYQYLARRGVALLKERELKNDPRVPVVPLPE